MFSTSTWILVHWMKFSPISLPAHVEANWRGDPPVLNGLDGLKRRRSLWDVATGQTQRRGPSEEGSNLINNKKHLILLQLWLKNHSSMIVDQNKMKLNNTRWLWGANFELWLCTILVPMSFTINISSNRGQTPSSRPEGANCSPSLNSAKSSWLINGKWTFTPNKHVYNMYYMYACMDVCLCTNHNPRNWKLSRCGPRFYGSKLLSWHIYDFQTKTRIFL